MCEFSSLRMLRILGVYIVDSCNPEPGDWRTYKQKPGARAIAATTSGTSCSGAKEHIINCKKTNQISQYSIPYIHVFISLQKQHQETTEAPIEQSGEVKTREESATFGYV